MYSIIVRGWVSDASVGFFSSQNHANRANIRVYCVANINKNCNMCFWEKYFIIRWTGNGNAPHQKWLNVKLQTGFLEILLKSAISWSSFSKNNRLLIRYTRKFNYQYSSGSPIEHFNRGWRLQLFPWNGNMYVIYIYKIATFKKHCD